MRPQLNIKWGYQELLHPGHSSKANALPPCATFKLNMPPLNSISPPHSTVINFTINPMY